MASRVRGECGRALCCGLQAWGSCWVEARGVQGGLALHQARFWVSCPDCPGPVKPVCVWLCVVGGRREEIGVAGTMGLSGILVLMEGVRLWGPRILTVLGHWRGRAGPGKGLPAWQVGPRAPLGEGGRRPPRVLQLAPSLRGFPSQQHEETHVCPSLLPPYPHHVAGTEAVMWVQCFWVCYFCSCRGGGSAGGVCRLGLVCNVPILCARHSVEPAPSPAEPGDHEPVGCPSAEM